jgi:hypothetical protein
MQDQPISLVERREIGGKLANSLPDKESLNVHRTPHPTLRYPFRSRHPWPRALLLEAQRSDLAMSIFKRGQDRSKRVNSRKEIIQLLWIILGAIVVVILGLYGGLASSHHH